MKHNQGTFSLAHTPTTDQLADVMTNHGKPLGGEKMAALLDSEQVIARVEPGPITKVRSISWLALACVMIIAISQGGDAYNFAQHDPLVWRVTNEAVRTGTGKLQACKPVRNQIKPKLDKRERRKENCI